LQVSSPGTVKGRVLYDDGKPPPAFTVAVGYGTPMAFATADGRFSVDVPGGAFNLAISGPTFIRTLVAIEVDDGGRKDLGTVTVKRGRSISGRVLDASGMPVAAATVAAGLLLTGDGRKLYVDGESVGAQETQTDAQGRFLMSGFPPASITVAAGKDGVGRSQSLSLPSGPSSAEVDLVLAATGSVSGTARQDGTPLAETIIIASPANGSSSNFFVTTGPDGSFALDTLTPGLYAITPIIGGGGDKHFRRVDIVAGQRAQMDIDVTTGPGSIEITVKTDAGEPVLASRVAVLGMRVDAPNMGALRYGVLLPSLPPDGPPVAFYTRKALGGPARVDRMKPGTYTACATPLPGDPRNPLVAQQLQEQVNSLPMKCSPVVIGSGEKKLTITVPAAWTKPSE
jgi:hypothetical protein